MTLMEPILAPDATTIRCTAADLRPAVAAAASVVERWNTIPVLGNLLITPSAGVLAILGTDLDTWIEVDCPAVCAATAPFTINARFLVSVLRGAGPSDEVVISRAEGAFTITVGPLTTRIRDLIPAEDFPLKGKVDGGPSQTVSEAVLFKLIDKVRWAISTEETRYYLNGIYLHPVEDMLAACATDGHRLALYKTEQPWPIPGAILPRRAVGVLCRRISAHGNNPVTVTSLGEGTQLEFHGQGWTLTTKMIDGTFPDYTRVLPKEPGKAYALLSSAGLRRFPVKAAPFMSLAAKLDLPNKRISVTFPDGMMSDLPLEADGNFAIGVNMKFLADLARLFGTIKIVATSPSDAATVLTEDPALTIVVMPMRL